jgi:hypothetical protein
MNRWLIQVLLLMVVFGGGFAVATLICHKTQKAPVTQKAPITFRPGGLVMSFQVDYHSSDGQDFWYSCYEHVSQSDAEHSLQKQIDMSYRGEPDGHLTKVGITERTATLDVDGKKFGERVVLDSAVIYWTEGARYHSIVAPSVEYALLFEKSRAWESQGCWKLPPREKLSDCRTVPNKSLNRSGGTDLRIICAPA